MYVYPSIGVRDSFASLVPAKPRPPSISGGKIRLAGEDRRSEEEMLQAALEDQVKSLFYKPPRWDNVQSYLSDPVLPDFRSPRPVGANRYLTLLTSIVKQGSNYIVGKNIFKITKGLIQYIGSTTSTLAAPTTTTSSSTSSTTTSTTTTTTTTS